jgi:hypothetical protein
MERPAPLTASPNLLYVDMRATTLTAHEVLAAAFPVVGSAAIGFELFAAQRTLGLVFASSDARDQFVNKPVGDTGLSFHPAPTHRVELRKFTISDVPILAADVITKELQAAFAPFGELVFLAPMLLASIGWRSSMWHATIAVPPEKRDVLPPPTASLFGTTIILDVPGTRRYCRHCKDTSHSKSTCRQGQRERARRTASASPPPPPHHQSGHQQRPARPIPQEAMEIVPSIIDDPDMDPNLNSGQLFALSRAIAQVDAGQVGLDDETRRRLAKMIYQTATTTTSSTTPPTTADMTGGHTSPF